MNARKGTPRYRAAKFIRRNRAAAAALALLAGAAGVSGIVWQAGVAQAARLRAERRFQEVRKLTRFLLFDFHDAVQKLPGSTPVERMLVERALAYLDSLAAEAGSDRELELELAEAYSRFGDVQGNPYQPNLGDTAGALASYRKALQLAEPLARADPEDLRAARVLAQVHARTRDVLFLLRRMDEATRATRQAVAILEAAGALRNYGQVADRLERLLKSDPENVSWQAYHAEILVRIGSLLLKTGQREEAKRQTARGLAKAKQAASGAGTPAGELTRAARLLLSCQPAELREPLEALRLAERAVELSQARDAYALDTLAEAQLQLARYEEARQTIERGLALTPAIAGQPVPWLRRMLESKLARLPPTLRANSQAAASPGAR